MIDHCQKNKCWFNMDRKIFFLIISGVNNEKNRIKKEIETYKINLKKFIRYIIFLTIER